MLNNVVLPGDGRSDSPHIPTRSTESRGSRVIVANKLYEANSVPRISDTNVMNTARSNTVSDGGVNPKSRITSDS